MTARLAMAVAWGALGAFLVLWWTGAPVREVVLAWLVAGAAGVFLFADALGGGGR